MAQLKRLGEQGFSQEALPAVRKALGSRVSLLVAKAAQVAGQWEAKPLVEAMEQAFGRFMVRPALTDKGCQAKLALAEALYRIGSDSEAVFLAGVRHVQMEPCYGGPVDTAPRLRGTCGLGLVRMNHPEAMNELARLLADRQEDARIMAARAVAYSGNPSGEPLLRYKAHVGDAEVQVLAECLLALLRLAGERVLGFVAADLEGKDEGRFEAAAIALGESHLAGAAEPLRAACVKAVDAQARGVLLLALASLRSEQAVEFLLGVLADSDGEKAQTVLGALATLRFDPAVRQRVAELVDRKHSRELSRAFNSSFDA